MKRLVLLLASLVVALPAAAAKDQFHLYNWNNYLAPETVKRFEEFCKKQRRPAGRPRKSA